MPEPPRRPTVLMAHDYPPFTGGGLALAACELARLLHDEFSFRVLSSRAVDHFADDRGRLAAARAADEPLRALATPRKTLRWLREADVVLVHWTFSFRRLSTLLLLAAPLLGRPTVCVIHTAPDHCDYNRLRRLPPRARRALFALVRGAASRCTAVVALSRAHAAALDTAGIRARVLPLPVAPDGRVRDGGERRGRLLRTVVIVGELSRLKGADAIPRLLPVLTPEFAVRIVGRGPLVQPVKDAVAWLSSEQRRRVTVSDSVEPTAMPRLYSDADCLLVLSRSESQSRVTLEAMLSGVVVLARAAGGVADLVSDGATGFLVDPDDPESVRSALLRVAADPEAVEAARRRAHRHAVRAADASAREWRRLLVELASSASPRRRALKRAAR